MTNLRSVGALLAISALLSCATAINDGTVPGPPTASAGTASESGGAPGEEGGAPAAGGTVEQAGQPGSAGKAVGGSSTSSGGKGGSSNGTAGSGSAGKGSGGSGSGSGGSVGVAGSHAGGSAGTSSSGGAGGSSAGSPGTGGGTATGPCDNPTELPATATGAPNFNTVAAVCFRTKATFNSISCSGFAGRTLKVNDVLDPCTGKMTTVPPMIDGWNYIDASAGTNQYANISWWTS